MPSGRWRCSYSDCRSHRYSRGTRSTPRSARTVTCGNAASGAQRANLCAKKASDPRVQIPPKPVARSVIRKRTERPTAVRVCRHAMRHPRSASPPARSCAEKCSRPCNPSADKYGMRIFSVPSVHHSYIHLPISYPIILQPVRIN